MSKTYLVYAVGCNKVEYKLVYIADSHDSAYSYIKSKSLDEIEDRSYYEKSDKNESDKENDDDYEDNSISFDIPDSKAYKLSGRDWQKLYGQKECTCITYAFVFCVSPNSTMNKIDCEISQFIC